MEQLAKANEKVVRDMLDHLVKAYEDFINTYPKTVDYLDGFMAAHNFHCVVVFDMEKRKQLTPKEQLFFRQVAIDTFKQKMENAPAWTQEQEK